MERQMKRQGPSALDAQSESEETQSTDARSKAPDAKEPDASARGGSSGAQRASAATSAPSLERAVARVRRWCQTQARMLSRSMAQSPRGWRALAGAAGFAGVLAVLVALQSPVTPGPVQIAPDTKVFSVSSQPTLVFDHSIGSVHIVPGPDHQVSIKETDNGETDAITANYAQHGDTITVTVDIQTGLFQDTWVDFDVSAPKNAGLKTTLATGTLTASDLSGPIALSGTNGSIWATNLTGSINLQTQSGSINLTNVSGQVSAATQNGTITTTATQLAGHSTVRAENGTINFHGTLSRTGHALFQNGNGAVGLTLPATSAFAVSATTASGSINTDFPGVTVSHQSGGSEAHGTVGASPRGQLTIRTAGGSIDLHQGG
jgi:hypothetical protein